MAEKKNVHAGHRQRLRTQFLEHGLERMTDIQALELLLFYAIPRQDTNPIAHRLLDAFDSLSGVLNASPRALQQEGGLTENAAALLTLVAAMGGRSVRDLADSGEALRSSEDCGQFLLPRFAGATEEMVYLLALDGKCRVLGCKKLFDGSLTAAVVNRRSVVEYAVAMRAASVVLAHNHPSGIAVPSREDVETTRTLAQALNAVDILLADHIVVADGDFVSMADSGYLTPPET